jgi:hypothetical protein
MEVVPSQVRSQKHLSADPLQPARILEYYHQAAAEITLPE